MAKLFAKEKQKSSRKESELSELFEFSLVLPGRRQVRGNPVDLNMDAAAIAFPVGECPDFDINERVRLNLTIRQTQKTIPLDAHVIGLRKDKRISLCQFKFIDTSNAIQNLDPSHLSYFNRREAFRISSDLSRRINVELEWDDSLANGWMIDVSTNGMCLGIESDIKGALNPSDQLALSFFLPEHESLLMIVGKMIRRIAAERHVKYGIEFDRKQTEDFKKQERAIYQYILQRQMLTLRMRDDE